MTRSSTRRRTAMGLVATMLVVVGACTPSEVDPEAVIDIAGSVRRQGNAPASGVRVALSREADVGEVFTVFATLGLACIDQRTNVCRGSRVTRTGSDGRFRFRLQGRDTQGFIGQASTMVMTTGLGPRAEEATGPITTYRFQVQTETLDLPVGFWEPRLGAATGPSGARVTWTPVRRGTLPPGIAAGSVEYAIEFRRGKETVWTQDRARSGIAFDARVLEDTVGTVAVVGALDGEPVTDGRGRKIDVVLRSGAPPYENPLGAPPSRGSACSVPDAQGRPLPQAPCVLTDGEFAGEFRPTVCVATGCREPAHRSVVVDLGERSALSLLVVRGCRDRCTVETSVDARRWRTAGVAGREDAALRLRPAVAARHVRVTSSSTISGLKEISAWSGTPIIPARSLLVAPAEIPGGSRPDSPSAGTSGNGDDLGVWPLVAVGAAGAMAGAIAVALFGRRRKRAV